MTVNINNQQHQNNKMCKHKYYRQHKITTIPREIEPVYKNELLQLREIERPYQRL